MNGWKKCKVSHKVGMVKSWGLEEGRNSFEEIELCRYWMLVILHRGILSSIKRRNSAGESSKFVNWISNRSQVPGLWTTRQGRKKKKILWIALLSAISPYANRTIRYISDDRQTRWKKLHKTSIVNLELLCRVEDLTAKICHGYNRAKDRTF